MWSDLLHALAFQRPARFTDSTSLSTKSYLSSISHTMAFAVRTIELALQSQRLHFCKAQMCNECEAAHISASDLTCKLTTPAVLCDWLLASISRMRSAVDSPPAMGHQPSVYESVDTPALCTDFPCTKCRHHHTCGHLKSSRGIDSDRTCVQARSRWTQLFQALLFRRVQGTGCSTGNRASNLLRLKPTPSTPLHRSLKRRAPTDEGSSSSTTTRPLVCPSTAMSRKHWPVV
jgi:hypothetical protein